MIFNFFRCDHARCRAEVTTFTSVSMALKGWVCTDDGRTYCPKHREKHAPGLMDTQTTDNYLAMRGYPREKPTDPHRNFDRKLPGANQ